ncbi:MAG: type IV toxin-antitoxin system AbiEi family antitoxin domain-containing protein [Gordonia sp. (in: high G+C Gram-positive bacteria)]|uniref:type IV toxin-antitoxin system AbiEi family antitoxin domain-containing protein n=1 Tax=Gordonia sp. (in: high G+C Gram-positive bacteria) TaxID=84139 RepID=UPI0039E27AA0
MTTTLPIDHDGAVRRRTVVASGMSATTLYRAVTAGALERIGSGLYVPVGAVAPEARHRLMLGDVTSSAAVVLSHESAAVVHGLPMLKPDLRDVHVTVPQETQRVRGNLRRVHVAELGADEVAEVGGHTVTVLERTAVDVAAAAPLRFAGALAVFDAALRRGAQPAVLAVLVRNRGSGVLRRALACASPLADGVGESWCRAQLLAAGLPRPRLKHPVVDTGGEVLAEPDMNWRHRVLGEFDGTARYQRIRVKGDSNLSAAWRAIARDDKLRARGVRVLRWTWTDLERRDVAVACRFLLGRRGLLC